MASLKEIGREILKRRHDGLAMFRAISPDMDGMSPTVPDQVAFFRTEGREICVRGGNRSGKTTCAAVRFAAIARDKPVCTLDGEEIEVRRPHQKGRPLLMWCIGFGEPHIGQTIYPKLFMAGAYKIIKDNETGLFRAWQPWNPEDVERAAESKPAPPLIPPSEIDGKIAWRDHANHVFSQVTLKHDGTVIRAYASSGEVKAGDIVDEIWVDERVKFASHYPEWQMRTPDVQGNICWSALTEGSDPAMVKLIERAEEQAREVEEGVREKANVVQFQWSFSGNPFILESEKDRIQESLDEDDLLQRDTGDLDIGASAIYPQFDKRVHVAIVDDPSIEDELSRVLRRNGGKPPPDWTHEMILDPGTVKPGVLFCAVPPPALWHKNRPYFIVWDEIYIRRPSTHQLAKEIKKRYIDIVPERFIIDGQAARQKPMNFSKTVGQNISDVLSQFGLGCAQTGPHFTAGDPDFPARSTIVAEWMVIQDNSLPRLRIVVNRCRNLVWQLQHNQLQCENTAHGSLPTDKPKRGQRDDLRDCFDSQTEVLTESGWSLFSGLSGDERLATVNLDANAIEYQAPTSLIRKSYSGDMISFGGHKLDALVTPGHRMVVYPRHEDGVPAIKEAGQLSKYDRLKMHAGHWNGDDRESFSIPRVHGCRTWQVDVDAGDFAEFLGWYIAEGCSEKTPRCPGNGYRVNVSQKKNDHREKLESLLASLPWKWTCHEAGYSCSSKQLWSYTRPLGDVYTKRVPDWVKQSSPRIIRRFLAGALIGDGWSDKGRSRYATVCRDLAGDIQELFIKVGVSASVREKCQRDYSIRGHSGKCKPIYFVSEMSLPRAMLHRHSGDPNYGVVQYEGEVFCASVPNSTLIVRRNGCVIVAGNCLEYWASRHPKYIQPTAPASAQSMMEAFKEWRKNYFGRNQTDDRSAHFGPGAANRHSGA